MVCGKKSEWIEFDSIMVSKEVKSKGFSQFYSSGVHI